MELLKKNLSLFIFSFLTLIFSIWYVLYAGGSLGFENDRRENISGEFGKLLGTAGGFALALVYARSALKIVIGQNEFWKRLEPINPSVLDLKKYSVKLLIILNKTHTYFGVLAIAFIFLHCYLTGSYLDNLLLQIVLVLMAVLGVSGFVMKIKYTPHKLRQKSYLIHRQFWIASALVIFTFFGHLILGD